MRPPVEQPAPPEATAGVRAPARVGWGFVSLYALSYAGGALLFLAPLLVSLALKVNHLVGIDDAPRNLALVTGVGSLLSIVSNPLFGRLSDRTTSRLGHAAALDDRRAGRRQHRHPHRRPGPEHRGGARRLVHRAGLPQRPARRPGRRAARPGAHGPARPGLRDPRHLPAGGVGGGHLPGAGLRHQRPDDVPRPVRGRRRPRGRVRDPARRPAARPGRPAAVVAAAAGRARSTSTRAPTPTSRGPSSAGSCWSWRTRSSSPTRPTT